MVFTPFTGKDIHGKLVTFGAALLSSHENAESYSWIFERFKDCMRRSPSIMITDQDPALKIAVKNIFSETRHRLCLWHIMLKVPEKVPVHLKHDKSLVERLNKIVWSDLIDPEVFDVKWKEFISDFGLSEISWLKVMYDARFDWIPAYFRNQPLSGLCRTTSISESANNFYGNFVSINCNLVEIVMKYDSAIETQRYTYSEMNSIDESSIPVLQTPILFEKHASKLYTLNIFCKVQKEIYFACFKCRVISIAKNEPRLIYEVNDGVKGNFHIVYDSVEETITCSCGMFIREGLLCCHIYILMKNLNFDRIPEKYVVNRWTRSLYFEVVTGDLMNLLDSNVAVDDNKRTVNTCISEFYECIGVAEGNNEKMSALLCRIRDFKDFLKQGNDIEGIQSQKNKMFYGFYGSYPPKHIDVLPPNFVKIKGSGSRLKSRIEKAIERSKKPLRTCGKCKKKCRHDSRNCGKE